MLARALAPHLHTSSTTLLAFRCTVTSFHLRSHQNTWLDCLLKRVVPKAPPCRLESLKFAFVNSSIRASVARSIFYGSKFNTGRSFGHSPEQCMVYILQA